MAPIPEKYWHGTFTVSVLIKAFDGLVEVSSGLLLMLVSPQTLQNILMKISRGEMTEDPQDLFFRYANEYLRHLTTGTKNFAGFYILAHGLLNVILIVGLWKQKAAAYLLAIGVITSFILFQIYRIALHRSLFLEILTVFDALFITLVYHEYKVLVKKQALN